MERRHPRKPHLPRE